MSQADQGMALAQTILGRLLQMAPKFPYESAPLRRLGLARSARQRLDRRTPSLTTRYPRRYRCSKRKADPSYPNPLRVPRRKFYLSCVSQVLRDREVMLQANHEERQIRPVLQHFPCGPCRAYESFLRW